MTRSSNPPQDEELAQALDAVLEAIQAGLPVDPGSILEKYPQLAGALDGLRELMPWPTLEAYPAPTVPLARPGQVGRYQIERELGAGSFGVVYLGYDPDVRRRVAIKVLHPGRIDQPSIVDRFQREAQACGRLRHPGIVQLYDYSRQGPPYYLVTEFVSGIDPRCWVRDRERSPRDIAGLLASIADVVQHAHTQGVCHRDLKPANILIDEHGQPHLLDFGLALLQSWEGETLAVPTTEGHILGSLPYMAPEQAAGKSHSADARSDIYSLGVILFELLTGRLPFQGPAHSLPARVIEDPPPSPRCWNPAVPAELEAICLKALAKRPQDRYSSSAALADDLRAFLAGEPIEAREIGWWGQLRLLLNRRHLETLRQGWPLLLILLGVTILVGSVVCNYWEMNLRGKRVWLAIFATKAVQVALMLLLAHRLRPVESCPAEASTLSGKPGGPSPSNLSAAERLIWSLVPGYYGSLTTLVIMNLVRDSSIPLAPVLCLLSGMGFACLGAAIWGWFFVWSGVFFLLTFAAVLGAPYGLTILGVGWFFCLLIGGVHLYLTR
ncbi:MAG: serine/threonine-protein kinase [Gemmataceae bacterium]